MNYQDYIGVRDMTWKILLDCGITRLPVSMTQVCKALGVQTMSYGQGYKIIQAFGLADRVLKSNGFLFRMEGEPPIVLYSHNRHPGRTRFTIAHELGHLMLGHTGNLISREPSPTDNPMEREANVFAARLLAPACVLWGLDAIYPNEIERLCNISRQAAEFRSIRMKELYLRNERFMAERGYPCFLRSPLEEKVYRQFLPFIQEEKERLRQLRAPRPQ